MLANKQTTKTNNSRSGVSKGVGGGGKSLKDLCKTTKSALNNEHMIDKNKTVEYDLLIEKQKQIISRGNDAFLNSVPTSQSDDDDDDDEDEDGGVDDSRNCVNNLDASSLSLEQQSILDRALEGESFFFTGSAGKKKKFYFFFFKSF